MTLISNSKVLESNGIDIVGIVGCVPKNCLNNDYFLSYFSESEINNICKSTGVKQRRWISNKNTYSYHLCIQAAKDLIKNINWDPSSIDGVIFVSQTHQNKMPAEACLIQNALDIPSNSFALDIDLGCSGYPYGHLIASSLINTGCKRVLLLVGETPSKIVDPNDKSTSLLFGDAGTATALEASSSNNKSTYLLGTDGSGSSHLICPSNGYLNMNGAEVFSFTLKSVPPLVKDLEKQSGLIHDYYLFHQANKFMLNHIIRKSDLDKAKCPLNISKYGNVSCASIPLLMASELQQELTKKTLNLACIGFGVGLSWAAMSINSSKAKYVNLIENEL